MVSQKRTTWNWLRKNCRHCKTTVRKKIHTGITSRITFRIPGRSRLLKSRPLFAIIRLQTKPRHNLHSFPSSEVSYFESIVAKYSNPVSRVVQSKNAQHPVGQHVVGNLGWRTHTICNPKTQVTPLPNYGGLPLSLALGVLGVSG